MGNPLGKMPKGSYNNANPMMQVLQMVRNGGNPEQLVQQLMKNNPQLANQIEIARQQNGGNISNKDLALQIMAQRGIDPNQMMSMFGDLGKKR